MAFSSSRQQNNAPKNITTRLIQFYSNGECDTTFFLSVWKNYLILNITPELPENKQTDSAIYDYDDSISVILNQVQIKTLYTGLKEMKAMKKAGKDISNIAISCKDGLFVKISDGKEYELDNWVISIIDKNHDDMLFYIFNSDSEDQHVYFNFNESTHKSEKNKMYKSIEFDCFVQILEEVFKGISSSYVTSVLNDNYQSRNYIFNRLDIIKNLIERTMLGGNNSTDNSYPSTPGRFSSRRINSDSNRGSMRIGRRNTSQNNEEEVENHTTSRIMSKRNVKEQNLDDDFDESEMSLDSLSEFLMEDDEEE